MLSLYNKFETQRIQKAEKQIGRTGLVPDPFAKFIVERTEICPHKVINENTNYWMDTICIFDGEMGLTLPCPLEVLPAVFFDALSIVRSARSLAKKEDK